MNRVLSITSSIGRMGLKKSTTANWMRGLSTNSRDTVNSIEELHRPLPPALYSDPLAYQMERENIFAKNWIYAGQLDRLNKLGDYLSITLAGYPIFIYRSPLSGQLVSFHNVCSHRAGPIVPMNPNQYGTAFYGNQSQLRCQYHSWLYDSRDGALASTPHFNYRFKSNEKQSMKLKTIRIEIFAEQFIFINMDDTPRISSINTLLKDLKDDINAFPLHEYKYLESQVHTMKCNWKTYVDNYQEGYHIHTIHPELDKSIQTKRYTVTNVNDFYSIHHAPSRQSNESNEKFLWLYLYPNLALNLYEKGYSIEQMLPLGKDQTIISYDFFVRSTSNTEQMAERINEAKDSIRRTLAITNEDKLICEQTQINLDSGMYQPGYLSPTMENGVHLFQNRLRRDLKSTNLQLVAKE